MDIVPPHTPPAVLPPAPQPFDGDIQDRYVDSTPSWPQPARPPADAPNVVAILFDDLGFGQLSCYGGPCAAPNIAALADNGLRYNNFHTTSLCSPSRAALITGRNHHSVGFSAIAEMASGFPGHNSFMPKSAATLPEILKQHGYSTYATGKWHLTPTAEATAAGPFDRWPLGLGFERFYGFLPGEVDQWHPILTSDNHRIPVPEREGYHVSEDLVDQALRMIRDQQQVASGRPFFLYLPFGAVHCPFHVPKEYIEPYRGAFDHGWDAVREETFQRQVALGIIPEGSTLPPRNPGVKPWDELSGDAQLVYARLMETFAGMVDHTDAQIGRFMDAMAEMNLVNDTMVMVMSDNGASQEGMRHGTTNTERFRNLMEMSVEEMLPQLDELGSHTTDPHYPTGWAMAGNAPFRRCKRDTHRGGNTDPLIIHWPAKISDPGAIRSQYLHITDVYPTVLELAGLPVPTDVNGVEQMPIEGQSFAASITQPSAPQAKHVQYYEMLGSRAIWHDGWMAVTWHRPGTDWDDDPWELYDQRVDYTQAHDLAETYPDKLRELIELWWEQAREHNVLPLDDRGRDRFVDPTRPTASEDRDVYRYYPDTSPVPNVSLPVFLNCPHSFTAKLRLDAASDHGLILAQGGNLAGWALIVKDGQLVYLNNYLRFSTDHISAPVPVGKDIEVTYSWEPTAVGEGTATLSVDGNKLASKQHMSTTPRGYSMVQEGLQVGTSWGTPVDETFYTGDFTFTGKLYWVDMRTNKAAQLRLA